MYEWSIQRYIVGLELLTGPVAIVLLQWSGLFTAARGGALAAGSMAFAVVCLMTVRPIDWGHLAWGKSWYTTNVPSTNTQPAIYFIDGASATSYLVQALPPASPVIGIINWENIPAWGDTVFTRRIHAILAHSAGSQIWAIAAGQLSEEFKKRIALYGLTASGPCQTTEGRPSPLTWCRLSRSAPTN